MSKRPITVRRVKNAMEKAVRLKGREYVYEQQPDPSYPEEGSTCTYAVYENGKPIAPSCIAGHALHYLGVPLRALRQYEGTTVLGLESLLDEYGVPVEARIALLEAQSQQDGGETWGKALDAFHEKLNEVA